MEITKKPELLVPAGDAERLHAALDFGADAVYLGGKLFSMRSSPSNFDAQGLADAIKLCHDRGVRVYLTCNTLPRNHEIDFLEDFLRTADACGVDALIAADLGVLAMIRGILPDMEIHMSTQTGIVNYAAANALYGMGVKRAVLARELSLDEIAEIRSRIPAEMELEVFVHGAMCVSFSGRCLLSSYIINRDANRGECAQPCRWAYHLMEEKRHGEFYPVFEDERGTYILNAKDLCMLPFIDKLADAGISSFKIEGRAKSAYYVSVIANAYRSAIDTYADNPKNFILPQWLSDEVYKVSHRQYCTGFFFGHPKECQYYENGGYVRNYEVAGIVTGCQDGMVHAVQRNKFYAGDTIELLAPGEKPFLVKAEKLFDENLQPIENTCHAEMKFSFPCERLFPPNTIIRIKNRDNS